MQDIEDASHQAGLDDETLSKTADTRSGSLQTYNGPLSDAMCWLEGMDVADDQLYFPHDSDARRRSYVALTSEVSITMAQPANIAGRSNSSNAAILNDGQFVCPYPNCARGEPFQRKTDLDRHIAAKHTKNKSYICPARGCFSKQNRTAFSRPDKLTAHMRTQHHDHTIVDCPFQKCSQNTNLCLLPLHCAKVHNLEYTGINRKYALSWHFDRSVPVPSPSYVKAVLNGSPALLRRCPLWQCKMMVPCFDLMGHIHGHDKDHLESDADALQARGLALIKEACTYRPNDSSASGDCSCAITSIAVLCPACGAVSEDLETFRNHMVSGHLVSPHERSHYEAWKTHCQRTSWYHTQYPTVRWYAGAATHRNRDTCPRCGLEKSAISFSTHHFDMFTANLHGLRPYREQILYLYPGFGTEDGWNSVWDDLAMMSKEA